MTISPVCCNPKALGCATGTPGVHIMLSDFTPTWWDNLSGLRCGDSVVNTVAAASWNKIWTGAQMECRTGSLCSITSENLKTTVWTSVFTSLCVLHSAGWKAEMGRSYPCAEGPRCWPAAHHWQSSSPHPGGPWCQPYGSFRWNTDRWFNGLTWLYL